MHQIRSILLFAALLLLPILACSGSAAQPASTPLPTGMPAARLTHPAPFTGEPVPLPQQLLPTPFAPFAVDVLLDPPAFSDLKADLTQLANPELLTGLNSAQIEQLRQSGFLVVPAQQNDDFAIHYQRISDNGRPIFLTSDAILHTTRIVHQAVIAESEALYLQADLTFLSSSLTDMTATQLVEASRLDQELAAAAASNLTFFAVGRSLLQPDYSLPPAVADLAGAELTLIKQAEGERISPLRGVVVDYRQFSPLLNRSNGDYAQGMRWFSLPLHTDAHDLHALRQESRQILLLLNALEMSNNWTRWERLTATALFFHGSNAALLPADFRLAAEAVYGGLPTLADLQDHYRLDQFAATLLTQSPQYQPGLPFETPLPRRFLPEAVTLDQLIWQQLIFNRVGIYEGDPEQLPQTAVNTGVGHLRGLARGADVAARFGAPFAAELLQTEQETAFAGYDSRAKTIDLALEQLSLTQWGQSLPHSWFYALQSLIDPDNGTPPPFMRSRDWQEKQLNSWYLGWLTLHHTPELVPLTQPAAELPPLGFVGATEQPLGYVEPIPELYGRLAAQTEQLKTGLDNRQILTAESRLQLESVALWLRDLERMAAAELRGENLSKADYEQLRQSGWQLRTFQTRTVAGQQVQPAPLPFLLTVHTNPNSGDHWQAGSGDVWTFYAIVTVRGKAQIAVGGIAPSYEFKRSAGTEIDAPLWPALKERPPRPNWQNGFIIP